MESEYSQAKYAQKEAMYHSVNENDHVSRRAEPLPKTVLRYETWSKS